MENVKEVVRILWCLVDFLLRTVESLELIYDHI